MRFQRNFVALFVALLALPASAAITGTVMSLEGQPVAGAKVSIFAWESPDASRVRLLSASPEPVPLATVQSDAKGAFSLQSPKEPVVTLRFDARGYEPMQRRVESSEDAGAIVLVQREMKKGTVTAGGKPVSGATVSVSYGAAALVTRTDDRGMYEAPDPKRMRSITVLHKDYAIDEEQFLGANTSAGELNRTLVAGGTLNGRAVAADGKTPVAGATITVDQWPLATSGEDGAFTLDHVPAKWTTLVARKDALLGQRAFPAAKPLSVRLEQGATVSGRITDGKSKLPVAGAWVQWSAPRRMMAGEPLTAAITDAKGGYSATIAAGSHTIGVSHPAFDLQNAEVTTSAGQRLTKDLTLTRLASVSGTVVDEEKRPVVAAAVVLDDGPMDGMPPMRMMRVSAERIVSGPDGKFAMRVPGDNEIRLRATKKGLPPARAEPFKLSSGERKSGVVLIIPSGVAVSGLVKDAQGDPLAGVSVTAIETPAGSGPGMMMRRFVMGGFAGQEEDSVRTARDGTFTLRVKEGTYDFTFKREGFAPREVRAQNVTANGGLTVETTLDPAVEIAGRVQRGGVGVPDVLLSAMGVEASAITGPDGSFSITGLSPGNIRLFLRKEGELQDQRSVTAPGRDVIIDIPVGGTVQGRVVEKETRKPVTAFSAGASMSRSAGGMMMMSPPMLRSFTSDDGSFTLEHVPAGAMNLIATATGFAAGKINVDVQDGKTTSDVVIELETGTRLTGKVTGSTGEPLSDASVAIQPSATGSFAMTGAMRRTSTDANGEYTLESLEPGEETISITHPKHNAVSRSVTLKGRETRLDVQLEGGRRVTGTVVTESGMPVADADVSAGSAGAAGSMGRSVRTNASGAFEFEALPPGRYRFTAARSGYASGSMNDVDISSNAPIQIVLSAGGTIYGRVTGLSASEYANATVEARSGRNSASSAVDPQGNYRIEGAPVGSVNVVASVRSQSFSDFRSSAAESVDVTAGGSRQVNLEFRGDTVIQGRVTRNGVAVGGASVSFQAMSGSRASAAVGADDQGHYRAAGLDAGEYRVMVADMQRSSMYTTTYTVRGSATFDIDYRAGALRGRVIDVSTNEPIANANITLRPTAGETRMAHAAVSDPNGAFTIDLVPSGAYSINATFEGFGGLPQDLTIGDSGREGVEVKLSRNDGVVFKVVDRDGRPVTSMIMVFDAQGRIVYDPRTRMGMPSAAEVKVPLPPGSYTATVSAPYLATRSISLTSPSTQNVPMSPGGTVIVQSKHSVPRRIRFLDASGQHYPRLGQTAVTTRELQPGSWPFENMATGVYTLQLVNDDQSIAATAQVIVREGETVRVEI